MLKSDAENRVFVYLISAIVFFSFILNINSLEFFHLSFKMFVYIVFVPIFLIFLSSLKTVKFSLLSIFIAIFLVYSFFVTIFGYYIYDGLFLLYFLFAVYITFISLENNQQRNLIIDGLFLIAYFGVLFTIFEYTMKSSDWMNIVIIPDFFYISNITSIGGFLYQPNLNALLINLGLIITMFKIVHIKAAENRWEILNHYIIYLFFAFAASVTASRAGMLAIFCVFAVIFIAKRFGSLELTKQNKKRLIYLFIIYIAVFAFNKYSPFEKFAHQGLIADNSIDERLMIWVSTILLWLKHPFFGTGLETFKFLNNPYQIKALHILQFPSDIIGNFTWTHNEPLQILEELGIFAFIPIVFGSIFYYIKTIRSVRNINSWIIPALLMIFFVQAGLSWPLRHPALLGVFFIILALSNNKFVISIKGKIKNIFLITAALIYVISSVFMFSNIKDDVKYSLSTHKDKYAKLNRLYKLSDNRYLFWMASSGFLHIALPYYMKKTTGVSHIPIFKDDIKDIKMTDIDRARTAILKKKILIEAKEAEKLHKIWISEYNLGMAYLFDGDLKKAKYYAKKGIAMNPNADYLWQLLHYINVKKASIISSKPIKNFLPQKKSLRNMLKEMNKMRSEIKSKNLSADGR